ncbi:MAG: ribose-phosphate diphosphokinase [Deltaproteobacteria bacterium]|nr:ribose-phosphate diphosphokinase [Deltaproteobacteria bacterium]
MSRRPQPKLELPLRRIHTFKDSERFARQLARALGESVTRIAEHCFPDGETLLRVRSPVARDAILVRSLHDPNSKLVETLLAADALRRAGAQRITLVAPYLPYMRQDMVFSPGEPLSQQVIANCLGQAFDGIVTLEPHLHRIRRLDEIFPCRAVGISSAPTLARWIQRTGSRSLVVGPDAESEPWVRAIAEAAHLPWIVGHKERLGDHAVRIRFPAIPSCTRAVIVDDIASSGVTLAIAAQGLRKQGMETIDAVVVHAIFAMGALTHINAAGIRRIVSGDTIPHPTNAIRLAPLAAAAFTTKQST